MKSTFLLGNAENWRDYVSTQCRAFSSNSSQMATNRHILLPTRLRESRNINALPEKQTMSRSTKMEHANFITLLHTLTF
jgi:hypothetical protein